MKRPWTSSAAATLLYSRPPDSPCVEPRLVGAGLGSETAVHLPTAMSSRVKAASLGSETTVHLPIAILMRVLGVLVLALATIAVLAAPQPGPGIVALASDDDDNDRETDDDDDNESEDERELRGQVIEVHTDRKPPELIVATVDGNVTVKVLRSGEIDRENVKAGDHVSVDGEKIHELLFEATDIEVTTRCCPRPRQDDDDD